jgi:Cytochrome c biogenesis factor
MTTPTPTTTSSHTAQEAKSKLLQNLIPKVLKDSSDSFQKSSPQAILQYIQDHKLHEPALVLHLALPLWKKKKISSFYQKIEPSIQYLSLLEQIVIAALFEKKLELASDALTDIQITAGANSLRYRKLLALCLEASEKYDDALGIYNDMLSENPSNVYALKRKYVILRSQLQDLEARRCLNDYLEQNGSDAAAWVEMAKTCMEQGDYKGAAYCYEEVVLFSPMDANLHCTLGELYVTIGGDSNDDDDDKGNYVLARKHFAQCLEFDKGHVRAMFGLVSATECYLECVEKDASHNNNNNNNNDKKKTTKKKEEEEDVDDVEFVKDLRAHGVQQLYKSFDRNTAMGGTNVKELLDIVF